MSPDASTQKVPATRLSQSSPPVLTRRVLWALECQSAKTPKRRNAKAPKRQSAETPKRQNAKAPSCSGSEELSLLLFRKVRFHRVPHSLSSANPQAVMVSLCNHLRCTLSKSERRLAWTWTSCLSNRLNLLTGCLILSTIDSGFRCCFCQLAASAQLSVGAMSLFALKSLARVLVSPSLRHCYPSLRHCYPSLRQCT